MVQAGEDHGDEGVEGWGAKGKWVRENVERAWAKGREKADDGGGFEDRPVDVGVSAAG